jgi:Reverse transcriptase (RNA-dependent DNA polymerase)
MCQAKGYEAPGKEHHVCRLNRATYGLKQSGREWYDMFCKIMYQFDFTRCEAEHAVFHRYADHDALIVAVDVNDLTMAGSSKGTIRRFKDELHTVLKIKDLGDLSWLLGIEVKRVKSHSLSPVPELRLRDSLGFPHPFLSPVPEPRLWNSLGFPSSPSLPIYILHHLPVPSSHAFPISPDVASLRSCDLIVPLRD